MKHLPTIRKYTLTIVTLGVYLWLCFLLGSGEIQSISHVFQVMIQIGVCIVLLPLLSLEYQDLSVTTTLRIGVLLLVGNLLFWGWPLISEAYGSRELMDAEAVRLLLKLLGFVALHFGLLAFFVSKLRIFQTRYRYSLRILVFSGIGYISLFLSAAFALFAGGAYDKLSLSCDRSLGEFKEASISFLPAGRRGQITGQVSNFQEATVGDLLSRVVTEENLLPGTGGGTEQGEEGGIGGTIVGGFQHAYQEVVQDIVDQKASIDQTICDEVLTKVETVSQTSVFRLSLILLLFVLMTPVITLVSYTVLLVGVLLAWILTKAGLYTWVSYETEGKTLH